MEVDQKGTVHPNTPNSLDVTFYSKSIPMLVWYTGKNKFEDCRGSETTITKFSNQSSLRNVRHFHSDQNSL